MASSKKKNKQKGGKPKDATTVTRSQANNDPNMMFFELDKNGRVTDGSTFLAAHDCPPT